jgi:N-acetyl-anhydromuramyl-L-alanine amidase AmpD
VQHDFTPEQYRSLAALAAALARVLPRIELDAPRDSCGAVRRDALSDEEEADFHGVLGHYHLQTDKRDPGPAFAWERFLAEARGRMLQP